MVYKFTKSGEKVIENASDVVIYLGHNYIGSEHILYGLAKEKNGVAHKVLEKQGIYADLILRKIEEIIGKSNIIINNGVGFTPRSKKIIENAYVESKQIGSDYISTEHLLIGLLQEEDSVAFKILIELNCNMDKMYNEILNVLNEYGDTDNSKNDKNNKSLGKTLNQYGTDLTLKAKNGKLDPVIRKTKRNRKSNRNFI